ncbi:putative dehydrogenase [Enterobacter asburiae]|uniref:Putative dehydrogenase n=1 Tax=Enterobacter asburiae TaxID=61645 RepID=A0A376F9Z4_ENTAS|nr:putative dehydrogenase [Enterobacter asburiae]
MLGPNAGLTADTAVSTPEETAEKMREEIRKTKTADRETVWA